MTADDTITALSLPEVVLSVPNNGTVSACAIGSVNQASARRRVAVRIGDPISILTHAFNVAWCEALNQSPRPTYFAMHHSDIGAEAGWLDTLIDELERVHADVMAAVIPIKDARGLTSTTIIDPVAKSHRRIAIRELFDRCSGCNSTDSFKVYPSGPACETYGCEGHRISVVPALPVTFNAGHPSWAPSPAILGINTGLWVAKLGPWADDIVFKNREAHKRDESGALLPSIIPEDWHFAIDLHTLGLSVYATTAVKLRHYGTFGFPNDRVWGEKSEDEWNAI